MMMLLIRYNADIEKDDCSGNTPLTIAVKKGHQKIVTLLLLEKVKPWGDKNGSYKAYTDNPSILSVLELCRKVSVL